MIDNIPIVCTVPNYSPFNGYGTVVANYVNCRYWWIFTSIYQVLLRELLALGQAQGRYNHFFCSPLSGLGAIYWVVLRVSVVHFCGECLSYLAWLTVSRTLGVMAVDRGLGSGIVLFRFLFSSVPALVLIIHFDSWRLHRAFVSYSNIWFELVNFAS